MNESVYGTTNVGLRRDSNEDAFLLLPDKHIYIISDGMGGHNAGEIASRNAIKTLENYFNNKELHMNHKIIKKELVTSVIKANQEILNISMKRTEYSGMGCTIVLCLIQENILHTCHIGDSRVYVINRSSITQITKDHSVVTALIETGKMSKDEALSSQFKNQLTQALGSPYTIVPEYSRYILHKDDVVMLCSDGLWDMLSEDEIQTIVISGNSSEEICMRLIQQANEAGGEDNITVIVIRQLY